MQKGSYLAVTAFFFSILPVFNRSERQRGSAPPFAREAELCYGTVSIGGRKARRAVGF